MDTHRMNKSVHLKITTRLIDEVISTNLDSPPYLFHLSEGQDIRDIHYPKRIGGWALHWVNTKGKTTQGSIVLVPNNQTTRRIHQQRLCNYYKTFGFDNVHAMLLSKVQVKHYHKRELILQLKQIFEGNLPQHLAGYLDRHERPTSDELIHSCEVFEKALGEAITVNRMILIIDIYKQLVSVMKRELHEYQICSSGIEEYAN